MARIVLIHGIAQQVLGSRTLHSKAAGSVVDGLRLAGCTEITESDIEVAFYGDLFRKAASKGDALDDFDELHPIEAELLQDMWAAAAENEPDRVPAPDAAGRKLPTPRTVQRALDALSHSRFLAGVADHFLIGILRQLRLYLTDPEIRATARERLTACIGPETSVIMGHSLGSVVAYEALCANPRWPVHTFVTLGSPLGIRNVVFDRLDPMPHHGRGWWPSSLHRWTNITDRHDVVALVKELAPLFGGKLIDEPVDNGWRVHDLVPHLTAKETGRAVAAGLSP
jgi:pimeloyl-ACP methyl ester carboxylesterase